MFKKDFMKDEQGNMRDWESIKEIEEIKELYDKSYKKIE